MSRCLPALVVHAAGQKYKFQRYKYTSMENLLHKGQITCSHLEVWSSRLSPKPSPLVDLRSPGKACPATVVVESGGVGGVLPVI